MLWVVFHWPRLAKASTLLHSVHTFGPVAVGNSRGGGRLPALGTSVRSVILARVYIDKGLRAHDRSGLARCQIVKDAIPLGVERNKG